MKNNIKTMFFLFSVLCAGGGYSDEQCYEYTEDSAIIVGIDINEKKNSSLKKIFSNFISVAKENDNKNIVKSFSSYDESRNSLLKSIKETPDKFSEYSGIKSFIFEGKEYRWGNYSFVYVDYKHTNGRLYKAESFFCASSCLMSDIFEKSQRDEGIDIVSRLLYMINKGTAKKVSCPNLNSSASVRFSLFPKYKTEKKFPFNVYMKGLLKSNVKTYNRASLVAVMKTENQACSKKLLQGEEIFSPNGEVNSNLVKNILERCTINTKEGSLIPVVFISKNKTEKRYLSVESYISRILSINKYENILQISDKKGRKALVARVDFSTNEQAILIIPYLKGSIKTNMFDWSFFGEGTGELLTNTILTNLYNSYVTGSE